MKNIAVKMASNPAIAVLAFVGFLGIFGPCFLLGIEVFSLGIILIMLSGDSEDGHVSSNKKA